MIYSIFGIKHLIMAKGKKRVKKQPERQDLFAIANAGRSHPSNTNHLHQKKPDTEEIQISTKTKKELISKKYSP
jgi:hypothetical protein